MNDVMAMPHGRVPRVALDEQLTAYLVYLVERDLAGGWCATRKLQPERARELAEALSAHLSPDRLTKLRRMLGPVSGVEVAA
jgi:hypothetical protein